MSNLVTRLPLQRKVSVALLITMAAFAAISYVILSMVIAPAFDELELSAARTDLVRAERAIQTDIENLEYISLDWAPWDDIYEYVLGNNPGFRKSNLDRPTLTNLDLDMVAVYALDSRLMWAQLLFDGELRPTSELGILGPADVAHSVLTVHDSADDGVVGIVNTKLGPMIISSQPILRSDDSGPVAGAIVMAQFLDDDRMLRLRDKTEVFLDWQLIAKHGQYAGHDPRALEPGEVHIDASEDAITSHTVLNDIFGNSLLILGARTPRAISALGQRTVTGAMVLLLAAGLLATVVIWFLLRGTILAPIEALARHIKKIRESGDLSEQLELSSNDEIGALAGEFDNLTTEVNEARKALLFQSFKAGKADTAAEVLHNIRNAMTPMINGIDRLTSSFRRSDRLRVTDATQQLTSGNPSPERIAKLAQYIDVSFDHVKTVNAEAADDMNVIMSQAKQIEAILADQEKFANADPVEENIVIDEVVGEAANVLPKDKKSAVDFDVDDTLARYRVRAHRIGLLQVLGNLILNAYEAIERAQQSKGQISLTASDAFVDEKPMVQLTVRDNGCGFEGDTGTQIFQRGYSSKSGGSSTGLGLHWCANAVAGMGGRIVAESPGFGQGAEFHVLLPAAQGG